MDRTLKTLTGRFVALEPLTDSHREALRAAASVDREIFTYIPINIADEFDAWFDNALEAEREVGHMPHVVRGLTSGDVLGSTRFLNISEYEPRLEIGYTWYVPSVQGTAVNPECKLLLMTRAFEDMGCVRVELKTDALNARSRAAIEKLGAKFEGILRKHQLTQGGRVRDSAYYSVLDTEWPGVKARLEKRLDALAGSEA